MPLRQGKYWMHDNNDGKTDMTPWVPEEPPPSELQEMERRRSAEVDIFLDPKVVTSNPVEIGFQSPASRRLEDNFSRILADNAMKCGYKSLRVVQSCVLPYLKKGADAAILTVGGTGKTTAYLLPLIQRVYDDLRKHPHEKCHVRAVILINSKEQAKYTLDKIRALTDGMNIRSTLMVSHMTLDAFTKRDNSDILITSPFLFLENLNSNRLTLRFLRYLVVDGFDDLRKEWNFKPNSIDHVLEYVKEVCKCLKTQFVYVADDPEALQQSYWNDHIVGNGGENIVIIENHAEMRLPPMNHLFIRTRTDDMIPMVTETIWQAGRGGQTLIVITNRVREQESFVGDLQAFLEKNGLESKFYHTQLCMGDRDAILNSFARQEFPILITRFTCQIRNYRFPGLKQMIHVCPPYHKDESYATAYSYSSRPVAFNLKARSVVLFSVDHRLQSGSNVSELVQAIKSSEGDSDGPKFKTPDWAKYFLGTDLEWRQVDKVAANQKVDLLSQLPDEDELSDPPRFDEPPVEVQRNNYVRDWNNGQEELYYPPGLPELGQPLRYNDSSPVVEDRNAVVPRERTVHPTESYSFTGGPPGLTASRNQPCFAESRIEEERISSRCSNLRGKIPESCDYNRAPRGLLTPDHGHHFDEAPPVDNYARRNDEWNNYARPPSVQQGPSNSEPRFYDEYPHEEPYPPPLHQNRRRTDSYNGCAPPPQQNNYRQPLAPSHSGNNNPSASYREPQRNQPQENWNNSYRHENGGNGPQRGQDYGNRGYDDAENYDEHNVSYYDDYAPPRQRGCDRPGPAHQQYVEHERSSCFRDEYREAPMNEAHNGYGGYVGRQPPQQQPRRFQEDHQSHYDEFDHQPMQQNQCMGGRERQGYGQERPPPPPPQQQQNRYQQQEQQRFDGPPKQIERNRQPQFNEQRQGEFRRHDDEQRFSHRASSSGGHDNRRPQGFNPRYGRDEYPEENYGHGPQNNRRSDFGRHDDRRGEVQQQRPTTGSSYSSQDVRFEKAAFSQDSCRTGGNERRDDGSRSDYPKTNNSYFYGMPDKPKQSQGRPNESVANVGKRFQGMTVRPSKISSYVQGQENKMRQFESEIGSSRSREGQQSGESRNSYRGRGGRGRGGTRSPQKNRSPVKNPSTFSELGAQMDEYEARMVAEERQKNQAEVTVPYEMKEPERVPAQRTPTQKNETVVKKRTPPVERSSETEEEADVEDSDDETHFHTQRRRAGTDSDSSECDVV